MTRLTDKARQYLSAGYDVEAVEAAWAAGDYGTLTDYATSEEIRPATADEALRSYESGPEGTICAHGRTCYVVP